MLKTTIEELLTRSIAQIYPSKEKLKEVLESGRRLRIYNGIDPTSPHLHLGHAVVLRKLAQFQELGHHVILLIGDFTGMIGDPTGKLSTRRQLTHTMTMKNAASYKEQVSKFLNFQGANPAEIKYNSEWLSKLSIEKWFKLASLMTYQQLIERDMFQKRIAQGKDIFLHEFFYPLMQAYDSVMLDVDMEMGGTDQTFNMLVGRRLMKKMKNKEKFVLTTKLLTDPIGEKIGKTVGNVINIDDTPKQIFGQIMALPDNVMPIFFELLTDFPLNQIKALIKENPLEAKKKLATSIVAMCHSEKQATQSREEFERVFQKKQEPTSMPVFKTNSKAYSVVEILVKSGSVDSRSQAKRLIEQGAIEINKKVVKSLQEEVGDREVVIKIGKKRFLKIQP